MIKGCGIINDGIYAENLNLQQGDRITMLTVTGETKQLGIIGCPVEHSFSPKMHNFISGELNADYIYSAWCVKKEYLKAAAEAVRALGIAGINVTAPYKKDIMRYLDNIDAQAKLLGSVNTVVNRDGVLTGYNTDAVGFCQALKADGADPAGKKILVMGAGGVVKPTLMRIIQEKPQKIVILNRTKEKAAALSEEIYKAMGFRAETETKDFDFDIVINTTSAGMAPQTEALPSDAIEEIENLDFINSKTVAVDMIYNPEETRFLAEAKKRGAKTVNGLSMLIYQGLIAYELFTGIKLDDTMADKVRKEVFGG